jgi:glyoxylase-like metal-dependent hydrolase (beta-lactamase superfamily II)
MILGRRAFIAGCACCASTLAAGRAGAVSVAEDIPQFTVARIADGVWLHTSWDVIDANGTVFPSNGLVIKGERETLVVDTTWRVGEMGDLMRVVTQMNGDARPVRVAVTHAHGDRMSGLAIARDNGARSLAYYLTQEDAPARGLPPADETWRGRSRRLDLGGRTVELFYPGPAHTRDNVTAFDSASGVLFGGCQVRAADAGLGNLADADVARWPAATRRLIRRYGGRARIVVPGHGEPGGPELLDHTLTLAEAAVARSG